MKLTYWISHCLDDSPVYSIRAKTRKAVNAQRGNNISYSKPVKVTVEYDNALDLLRQALSEGGIDEGRNEVL